MKEIEVKILEINQKLIEKKILSLGGKKVESNLVCEKFYDFPDGLLKSKFSSLRLRTLGKKCEFTLKHGSKKINDSKFKIREEIQTDVSDVNELEKIIKLLGLVLTQDREKKRTSFILGKAKIEIDEYPGVPPYLEIEADEKTIELIVKKLGFTMKDTSNLGSGAILRKYKKSTELLKF